MSVMRKRAIQLFNAILFVNIVLLLMELTAIEDHEDINFSSNLESPEELEKLLDFQIKSYLPKLSTNNCMCGLSTYFNPLGLKSKKLNFIRYARIARAQGLNLTVIELYSNEPEINGENCDQYKAIKIDESYPLWQKEALLNVGLKHLKHIGATCKNVAWLDIEIMFTYPYWIERTCKALEEYDIVQPFISFHRLNRFDTVNFNMEKLSDNLEKDSINIRPIPRRYGRTELKHGMVWAANRRIMNRVGFFPYNIVGGGDSTFIDAIYHEDAEAGFKNSTHSQAVYFGKDYVKWATSRRIYETFNNRIAHMTKDYTAGVEKPDILHFWHGSIKNREYFKRWNPLYYYNFTPSIDIHITEAGYLTWSDYAQKNKPGLMECVKEYFLSRREEGGRFHALWRGKTVCEKPKKRKKKGKKSKKDKTQKAKENKEKQAEKINPLEKQLEIETVREKKEVQALEDEAPPSQVDLGIVQKEQMELKQLSDSDIVSAIGK